MHYQKAFSCFGSFAETWFDFSSDILYLRWETYMQERGYGFSGACLAEGFRTLWGLRSRGDVRKVEHLAFMLDPDNFHDFDHPFTREENDRIYTTMVADLLCFFGGLKTFTVICDHYADDGHFDIEFRSPIDYDKAVDRYCNFEYAPKDEWEEESPNNEWEEGLMHPFAECLHINTKVIEDIKSMRNLEGRESWWKFPQFEEKVAISKERREGLDGLYEMVWEVIDELNKHFEATRRMMHDRDTSGSSVADEDLDLDGDGSS
ncbi:hypothetical protein B0O99DRAFT_636443 [Bisporella sp. PMI_857]|nr:hypothetical protein B0O99DRAFT_636443 [Bisporella sp. PMI_857]